MSRVIKFRGLWEPNCDDDHDGEPEFIYGSLIKSSDCDFCEICFDIDKSQSSFVEVNPETVGQFTGILDSEGQDIYEGDILRSSYGIPPVKVLAPVVFMRGGFYAMTPNHNPKESLLSDFIYHLGYAEVIGNVHQNPALLEVRE